MQVGADPWSAPFNDVNLANPAIRALWDRAAELTLDQRGLVAPLRLNVGLDPLMAKGFTAEARASDEEELTLILKGDHVLPSVVFIRHPGEMRSRMYEVVSQHRGRRAQDRRDGVHIVKLRKG